MTMEILARSIRGCGLKKIQNTPKSLDRILGQFFKTDIQGTFGMLFAKRKAGCCPFLPSLASHLKVSDPRWKKAPRFHFFSLVFGEFVGEMKHGMHDASAIP